MIRILVPVVVPWPLDLTEAPVNSAHFEHRLKTVANGAAVPTRINIIYCRDREQAIARHLAPHSIVVVGWRRRRLFDSTGQLVKRLRALGHHVVPAGTSKGD